MLSLWLRLRDDPDSVADTIIDDHTAMKCAAAIRALETWKGEV